MTQQDKEILQNRDALIRWALRPVPTHKAAKTVKRPTAEEIVNNAINAHNNVLRAFGAIK